jgi:hypothetical protein
MVVRNVRHHGHFRWKKEEVFLSEVFWGERVGLLPEDDRYFTVYFAQIPLARFASHKLLVTPLPKITNFANVRAREEDAASSSLAPQPLAESTYKVSGMCPV